jgi:hypothetical protein
MSKDIEKNIKDIIQYTKEIYRCVESQKKRYI